MWNLFKKKKKQNIFNNNSISHGDYPTKIDNGIVGGDDFVLYELSTDGYKIIDGYKVSNKIVKKGTVIGKTPSVDKYSPVKITIRDEKGSIDEVLHGDVIKIIRKGS